MQRPLVSIITVVLNGEDTLEQTIESVINQTYLNIEYIVIDGGSTDGTQNIIKKYEDRISFWISEPDQGLYDAMNKGIKISGGEIIGIINSDDWYEPNAVELVVNTFSLYPDKEIFHGDRYDVLNDSSKIIRKFHPSSFKFMYYGMTFNHPSMFIHRNIYKQSLYNINLSVYADYEFVLTQFLKKKNSFHYIPEAYVNYRLNGISSRLKLMNSLYEGFISRKNAGQNIFENIFSLAFRFTISIVTNFARFCIKNFLS